MSTALSTSDPKVQPWLWITYLVVDGSMSRTRSGLAKSERVCAVASQSPAELPTVTKYRLIQQQAVVSFSSDDYTYIYMARLGSISCSEEEEAPCSQAK